jgi:hypothetical protein
VFIVPALLLVLGLAACGGKSGGDDARADGKSARGGGSTDAAAPGQIGDAATAGDKGAGGSGGKLGVPSGAQGEAPSGEPGDVGSALASDYKFTGKGSDAFCKQMGDLQASYAKGTDANPSFAGMAAQVAKINPPPELEADWPTFVKVQESLAKAPEGQGPDTMDQATLVKFADASNKVSAYLTNVCGL